MTRSTARLLVALTLVATLPACSWFRADRSGYLNAKEVAPLEVPPGLDAPSRSNELVVPPAPASGRVGVEVSPQPPSGDAAPVVQSGKSSYTGTETSLLVADEPAGAFRRVQLALDRSGVMTIASKDEEKGTITLKRDTVKREGGWIRRMLGRTSTKTESITRVVHLVPEGTGVRVQVEDEGGREILDETAREIIAALRARLG